MNLMNETVRSLEKNGKTKDDVLWCGSEDFGSFLWEDFVELADTEYDAGFGGQEVAKDLLIVGADFWLERWEYDGSEGWEYKTFPKMKSMNTPTAITTHQKEDCWSWSSLSEMNGTIKI